MMGTVSGLSLADAVRQVRDSGRQVMIRCPVHEDRQASLSVWQSSDGWVHFKCHAGCAESALETTAGLSRADRAPPGYVNGNGRHPNAPDITYDYVNGSGKVLFQVVRRPGKQFRQRRPDPVNPGEWLYNLEGISRGVVYRLPEVLRAIEAGVPIWVVEGEKDVASCEARGLVATCNAGGAGKWRGDHALALRGASAVTIVADKDEPGGKHANAVAVTLRGVGVREWRIVTAASGKDATDHFDAGHGVEDFVEVKRSPTGKRQPGPVAEPEPVPTDPDRKLTEDGNGDRFAEMYADDVRYVDDSGSWFVWDGRRFQRDTMRSVFGLARDVVTELYQLAAREANQARRKDLADHAKRSDAAHAFRGLLDCAKDRLACRLEDFDRATDLLTIGNGTLDLTTGELLPAERAHLSTRLAAVDFDPEATCPRWDDFLWRVFDRRSEVIRYVQKAVGYSLTGDQTEQCLFLLYGSGANGKSTFLETVRQMLGDYGHTAKTETVLLARDERSHTPRPDLLDLRGRRLVTASEVVEGKHFNEALVKSMTGGEELNARALYGSSAVTFTPSHKLWLGVNHLPVIRGDDEGIWRRIRVIPFSVTIPEGERDPGLPAALRAEWPGILRWALQGCLAWRRERLGTPPTEIRQATSAYREESDLLADFLTERCVTGDGERATGGGLYLAYKAWATASGFRPASKNIFAAKLNVKGFVATKSHGTMVYRGIGLSKTGEEIPEPVQPDGSLFGGDR